MNHGNAFTWFLLLGLSGIIVVAVVTAQRGGRMRIRRIAGLSAIDEAVGRATEMGRPMLFSAGLGGLGITTLQALAVLGHVSRLAARYGSRVIVALADPTVYPVAEETVREAYGAEGKQESFRSEEVRFVSDRQFAYAAGCVGLMNRERVAANFFFGDFYAESLILGEAGREVGAMQIAGTPQTIQIPFFIAACDYVIIGDEYYAASAYLTQEPTLLGSLVGQDIAKLALGAVIVLGLGIATWLGAAGNTAVHNLLMRWLGGG